MTAQAPLLSPQMHHCEVTSIYQKRDFPPPLPLCSDPHEFLVRLCEVGQPIDTLNLCPPRLAIQLKHLDAVVGGRVPYLLRRELP